MDACQSHATVVIGDADVSKGASNTDNKTNSFNIVEANITSVKREKSPVLQNKVFVLDTNKKICNPITSAEARILLTKKKASVFRLHPFTIILKEVSTKSVKDYILKIDPGVSHTGLVIVDSVTNGVVWGAELHHRQLNIKLKLFERKTQRRGRRNRNLRYRPKRYINRKMSKFYPSVKHIFETLGTWVRRITSKVNITFICIETVKFDSQKMSNPKIQGLEYQRGALYKSNLKEKLNEKNKGVLNSTKNLEHSYQIL